MPVLAGILKIDSDQNILEVLPNECTDIVRERYREPMMLYFAQNRTVEQYKRFADEAKNKANEFRDEVARLVE